MGLNNQLVEQAVVVSQDTPGFNTTTKRLALFNEDGSIFSPVGLLNAVGFFVARYYKTSNPTPQEQHNAFAAACADASLVGGTVILPENGIKVVGSFSMSGYSCSIEGSSIRTGTSSSRDPLGCVIECVSQTGPVLDFTGFIPPPSYVGRLHFRGFAIKGDGTADPSSDTIGSVTVGGGTKKGLYSPPRTLLSVNLSDLLITNCGGIHLDVSEMYLSSVTDVIVTDPISAATNNVPYIRLRACNGSNFYGLGIRALGSVGTANVGVSGAIRLEASVGASGYWDRSTFYGCWSENCWLPDGGTILVTQTTGVAYRDWMHYDARRVTGATNTSYTRVEASSVGGTVSGNLFSGFTQGSALGTNDVHYHYEVFQGYNHFDGVKGYPGHNIHLNSTIRETYILLGGNSGASAPNPAVVDDSGRQDNTIIDTTLGLWQLAASSGNTVVETLSGQHVRQNRVTSTISTGVGVAPDLSTGSTIFVYTLNSAGISISAPTGTTGQLERTINIIIKQDATGSRTLSFWSGSYAWKSGSAPVLKTAANAVDTFQFVYDGSTWQQI